MARRRKNDEWTALRNELDMFLPNYGHEVSWDRDKLSALLDAHDRATRELAQLSSAWHKGINPYLIVLERRAQLNVRIRGHEMPSELEKAKAAYKVFSRILGESHGTGEQ
jgi:hypothetical protein